MKAQEKMVNKVERPGRGRGMHAVRSALVLLALVGASVACAPDGSEGLSGEDSPLAVSSTDLFRVGAVDGEDWETFSRVTRVRFDGAGNLYILDPDAHRVIVVDPGGRYLRTVGSRGEGPGELRIPMMMEVMEDGTVVIGDLGARALALFAPDGSHIRSIPDSPSPQALLHPSGGIVQWGLSLSFSPGQSFEIPTEVPVSLTSMDGSGSRVLGEAWQPPRDLGLPTNISTGSGGTIRMQGGGGGAPLKGFEPRIHVAVLADGRVAVADSSDYRIRLLDPAGGEAGSMGRDIAPRRVTDELRKLEREDRLARLSSGAAAPPMMIVMTPGGGGGAMNADRGDWRAREEERVASMTFWEEVPVIQRMAADLDGRLWVERSALPGSPGPIDLLSSSGDYLGSIAPEGVRIPAAFGPGGTAAYIERDELDLPFIRVVRLSGLP